MKQNLAWPVNLQRQEDGVILVSFPDIPEALTEGATEADALEQAQDCLIAALEGYVGARRPIPSPSPGARTGVSGVAGTDGRQNRALRSNARAGCKQHGVKETLLDLGSSLFDAGAQNCEEGVGRCPGHYQWR